MLDYCQNKEGLSEGQLYKILTQFMGMFRRFIKTSQHICKTITKPATYNQNLSNLNTILSQFKTLTDIQSNQLQPSSHLNHTYIRFIARLFEIISLTKTSQYQATNIGSLFRNFINKTENFINNFKIKKNLAVFFKSIYYLSTKFYEGCGIITKNGSIKQALQVLSKIIIEQKPISNFIYKKQEGDSKKTQIPSKPTLSQSQLKLFTINCIDIDCDYVTSMIFLGANKKEDLLKLMNERNRPISQLINTYYKQFNYYLKKLQRSSSKNKLKQGKSLSYNYNTFTNNFKFKNKIKNVQTGPLSYQSTLRSAKEQKSVLMRQNLSYNSSVKKEQGQSQENYQYMNSFHPIKNTYLTFNNIVAHSVKHQKTPKNSYFKNAQDAKKIKYILKTCKYPSNSAKSQTSHPQQTAILQIKRFNLNSKIQKNAEKLLQLFSLGSQEEEVNKIEISQKWQIIDKSKKIRNIRKSQMSKTFSKFNIFSSQQIVGKIGVSCRTKTQNFKKQCPVK